MARKVGSQSWCCTISLQTDRPRSCRASARAAARGTRLPSWCSSRCGTASCRRRASCCGAARCRSSTCTKVLSAMPSWSSRSSIWPTFLSWSIMVSWYGDCQRPAWPRLSVFVCVNRCMCVVLSHTKNGLPALFCALDEVLGGGDELVVAGFHALLGQRAGVLDLLLADLAPARLDRSCRPCRWPRSGSPRAARTSRGTRGSFG